MRFGAVSVERHRLFQMLRRICIVGFEQRHFAQPGMRCGMVWLNRQRCLIACARILEFAQIVPGQPEFIVCFKGTGPQRDHQLIRARRCIETRLALVDTCQHQPCLGILCIQRNGLLAIQPRFVPHALRH